jgi:hypothetical protein
MDVSSELEANKINTCSAKLKSSNGKFDMIIRTGSMTHEKHSIMKVHFYVVGLYYNPNGATTLL